MINLRLYIRKVIEEALKTVHFRQRVDDRLNSESSTFINEKQEIKDIVYNNVNFLESVNFPGQDNIGILLFKSPNKYIYHADVDGKIEHSEGNFIWIVIRGDDMETIVFGDAVYKPKNTQITTTINALKQYINEVKNGDANLTEKDLARLKSGYRKPETSIEKPKEEIFIINGVKWIPDFEKGILHQKNNADKTMSFDDALEILDAVQGERLLSLI